MASGLSLQTWGMELTRTPVASLEMLFDPHLEARIRAEWQALAAAGYSSLAAHPSPTNRPHLTLVARPSMPPIDRAALDSVITLPIAVTIGDPVLFGAGDRRVLARFVVPTTELFELHAALHTVLGRDEADAPHTRVGEWTPHITLARRIRRDDLPEALRLLDTADRGGSGDRGEGTTLRHWDPATATVTHILG